MILTNEQGVLEHTTFEPVPGTRQPNWAELHRLNRVWREWMDSHSKFVTPDTVPTVEYAACETREAKRELRLMEAELMLQYLVDVAPPGTKRLLDAMDDHAHRAMDLWLREKLPHHARNNTRMVNLCQELAQVVMLALTALPDVRFFETIEEDVDPPTVDYICDCGSTAVMYAANDCDWEYTTTVMLMEISHWPGLDIAAELRRCWSALAWKHASYHMHEYPQELK